LLAESRKELKLGENHAKNATQASTRVQTLATELDTLRNVLLTARQEHSIIEEKLEKEIKALHMYVKKLKN
tara:strand:- start:266 stop:478 length:213 start_codon:yes stop_codon:yes gene_type:complete